MTHESTSRDPYSTLRTCVEFEIAFLSRSRSLHTVNAKLPNPNNLWNGHIYLYPDPDPYQTPPYIHIYIPTQTAGSMVPVPY